MKLECKCGAVVEALIREGNNPGCKEREFIYCPTCGVLLYSGVYNDADVYVTIVK